MPQHCLDHFIGGCRVMSYKKNKYIATILCVTIIRNLTEYFFENSIVFYGCDMHGIIKFL